MTNSQLRARVLILPKKSLRDPQGETIFKTLNHMELGKALQHVTKGSLIELAFAAGMSREDAEKEVAIMCEKLLVNSVIERFEVEWQDESL